MLRRRRQVLIRLSLSTGLIGSLALVPSLAQAQSTPASPTVIQGGGIKFNVDGVNNVGAAAVDGTGTDLTVDLGNSPASIIEWNSFDIANGSQAIFNSSLGSSAVLNRVTGATFSNLAGTLSSSAGVSVFLVNTNGIMLGATGVISTGSFVASSLELSDADFNTGLTTGKFHFASAGTAAISTAAGSTINLSGGDYGLLMVAPQIVSNGDLDTGTGEAAFVLASDTNVTFTAGSPLAIEINAGTPLSGATIGGTVAGRNVYFAAASKAAVVDYLLGVTGNVTAAAGAERGIVISAGAVQPATGITYGVGDTAGSARIVATGSLTSGANVVASANNSVSLAAADGPGNLVVAAGGAAALTGALGGITPFATVDVTGTAISLAGNVTSTGAQAYHAPVTLGADATLASTGGGAVTFDSTINGGQKLTVNTAGATSFGGAVGGGTRLTSLITDAGGTTLVNGDRVWTTGLQTFGDAVTLGAATTLFDSSGAGAITFGDTLDGASAVTVTTGGLTTFGGAVGGTTRLTSLATDASGSTAVDGDRVRTTGLQNFADAVTVGGSTTLFDSNSGGAVTFAGALDGGSNVTVTTSGLTSFAGAVGGGTRLTSLATDGGGTTAVGGAVVQTTGLQNFADVVTLGGATTLFSSNGGGGAITFGSTLDGASDVTVTTSGLTTFTGAIGGGTRLTSLITDGGGTTAVNGDRVRTTGLQNFADAVTVGGPTTLFDSSGAGAIAFGGTLDGGSNVTVTTGGLTTFGGSVGGTTRLTSLATDAAGTTAINGDRVRTTGSQNFADAVTLGGPATMFDSNGGGAITFGSTLDGASDVTVGSSGLTTFANQVGGLVRLTALRTNGGGTTALNGDRILTTGLQNFADALTITSPTTLFDSNGGGAITFGGTLDGASALTVTTGGLTTFGGAIGGATRLISLNTDAAGSTAVNGDRIQTTSLQNFADAVTVGGPTTLFDSNGGGAISFGGTLDGGSAVTVNTSALTSFAGAVGGGTRLVSLATGGAGTTAVNGDRVWTTGLQNFADTVTLGGATTLFDSNGGGAITFGSTLDGASDVSVTTSGLTTFGAGVGGIVRLTSLTTDGGGSTVLNGALVQTTGLQNFADVLTVAGPTTLFDSTGGGAITFGGTLDGASAVTVATGGVTTFGGNVGGIAAPISLLVNGGGSTSIAGVNITTSGGQSFGEPVNLFTNGGTGSTLTTLTSTGGGAILLSGNVVAAGALQPESLLIQTAGTATLGGTLDVNGFGVQASALTGPVSATINTLAADLGGPLNFVNGQALNIGTVGSLAGVDVGANALTLTANGAMMLSADVQGGAVTFNADSLAQNAGTRLNAATLAGAIVGTADLTSILNGIDALNGFSSNGLSLRDSAGGLIVNGPVDAGTGSLAIEVGAGDLALLGNLSADTAMTLTADAGQIAQTGGIIDTPSLNATGSADISLPNANLIGAFTALNSSAGSISARSAQPGGVQVVQVAAANDVLLTGDNSLALTNAAITSAAGDVTLTGAVTLTGSSNVSANGAGGSVTFSGAVNGPGALAVSATAGTLFNGEVGAAVPLASLVTGLVTFAGSVVTDGAQSYGNVVLTGATNPRSFVSNNNQAITFGGTLDGAYDVTVRTGGLTSIDGAVGATNRLTALTTDGGGTTSMNGAGVQTTGLQNFVDAVTLGGAATLFDSNGGGAISFRSTLDGGSAVTVNTAGLTTFGAGVGGTTRLASLATAGGGTTAVNGNAILTTGAQTFADAVTVAAPATNFDSNGGAITFGSTLDGASAVTVSTGGLTTFGAAVGGTTRLTSLTTLGGGTTAVNGGAVRTTGLQSFGGGVTVAGPSTNFESNGGGAITFGSTLDGGSAVTVNTSGVTAFLGPVGGTTRLDSLATDSGGSTTVNGGLVRTVNGQAYGDAVTVADATTVFDSTGGTIAFGSTLDGGSAVTVRTSGLSTFGGQVGGTTRLTSLTADGGGTTAVNGGLVRTAGVQNFADAVTVAGPTTLFDSNGGAIAFGSTLDGGSAVTVSTSGLTTFGAGIGGTTRLASLTANGGGTTAVNGDVVRTTGLQTFADAVTLAGSSTTFDSNAGGAVTFGSTLDGGSNVTVTTSGLTTFGAAVGGTTALASLAANGGGVTAVNGGLVVTTSTGTQNFLDQIALGADTEFRGLSGSFAGGLLGNGHNLTLNYGGTSLIDGGFSGIANLVTGAGGITQIGGTISTTGLQTFGDAVSLVGATTLVSAGDRAITFTTTLDGGQDLTVRTGGAVSLTGVAGGTTRLGNLTIVDAGTIDITDARVGGATLSTSGSATLGNLDATGAAALTAGNASIGTIAAGSSLSVTAGTVGIGSAKAGSALVLSATGGALTLDTAQAGTTADLNATGALRVTDKLTSGGAATLSGSTVDVNSVAAGSALKLTATGGALTLGTGQAGTTADLTATDILRVTGSLTSGEAATLSGKAVDVNSVAAGSALEATATGGALTLGTGQAGANADLTATGALEVTGSLTSSGAATLSGSTVEVSSVAAGSALKLTATGGTLTLDTGTAGTTADLDATGDLTIAGSLTSGGAATIRSDTMVDLGVVAAGPDLTITARDMDLHGAVSADTVRLVNGDPANTVFRLGTAAQDGGLSLSAAEINLIASDTLTLDGGNGTIEIGDLAFESAAGSDVVNVLTTGDISILGAVSGNGANRLFNFGGDGAGGQAATIFALATPDAGGRLLFEDAALQLNGNRIAFGQQAFLDAVRDANADTVASQFISNPNSSLYNSFIDGVQYNADAGPLLSAGSLAVNYGNFALVQNTGLPGVNSGVVIGALNSPSAPALTLTSSSDASGNAFALFGTVNGIADSPAAVLGSNVLVINHVVIANTRVNGCIIGSGAGCLTTTTTQPTLNFFDSSALDVLTSSVDFSLPFDPLIGSNNEAFYSGFGSADVPVVPQAKCDAGGESGSCPDDKE